MKYIICIIFVAATEEIFNFNYTKKTTNDDKDSLEATCTAKGLYPQPTLDISVKWVSLFTTLLKDFETLSIFLFLSYVTQ